MVPLQDAALKKDDAENIYHVQPGDTFVSKQDGKTYRYADVIPDWSPAKPGYADVYDPSHPPDTGGSHLSLRSGQGEDSQNIPTSDADEPTPGDLPAEDPGTPPQSPLDTFRTKYPENSAVSDEQVLGDMHSRMAPDMPFAKFSDLARNPHGFLAIENEVNKGLNGLGQIKKLLGEDATGKSDDEILQSAYDRMTARGDVHAAITSFQDFKDRMAPTEGPINAAYQFWKGASRGSSEATHGAAGEIYSKPQDARDFSDQIYKMMDGAFIDSGVKPGTAVRSWAKAADDWLNQNTGIENYWQKFVGWMNGQAQLQNNAAQKDAARASHATGFSGKAGRVLGQEATGTVEALGTLYMPGAPLKSAVMLAGAWEGLSKVGAAVQAGHENALLEGIQGAGTGALLRYMMDAPAGRKASAFSMWLANTGEDTIQKWLRGEKVDWQEQALRSVVDIGAGVLIGKEAENTTVRPNVEQEKTLSRELTAKDILGTDTGGGGTWFHKDPIVTRDAPSVFTPKTLFEATGRLPKHGSPERLRASAEKMRPAGGSVHMTADDTSFTYSALNEEIGKVVEARDNGDYHKAAEHLDNALSIATPKERRAVAKAVIKTTTDAANNRAVNIPENLEAKQQAPKDEISKKAEEIVHQNLYGLSPKFKGRGQSGAAIDVAGEIHDWFQDTWPKIQEKLSGAAEGVASIWGTHVTDVFGKEPGAASKMDAISVYHTSEAQSRGARIPMEIARALEIGKVVKGGEKVGRRAEVFDGFTEAQQKEMVASASEGELKSGNKAADFIVNKLHRVAQRAMASVEHQAGIDFELKDYYVYQLLKDKANQDRFESQYGNKGGDPRFAKHRQFPTARQAMEAGFEFKTYNLERLFQARVFAHTQAIRKIMTLREAEENGIAFRTNEPELDPEIKK